MLPNQAIVNRTNAILSFYSESQRLLQVVRRKDLLIGKNCVELKATVSPLKQLYLTFQMFQESERFQPLTMQDRNGVTLQ